MASSGNSSNSSSAGSGSISGSNSSSNNERKRAPSMVFFTDNKGAIKQIDLGRPWAGLSREELATLTTQGFPVSFNELAKIDKYMALGGTAQMGNLVISDDPTRAEGLIHRINANQQHHQDGRTLIETHVGHTLNFAIKNTAINLTVVRSSLMKYKNAYPEKFPLMISLGIAAVASIKSKWAAGNMEQLKFCSPVPKSFAGEGGTFKAFLFAGYDYYMHLRLERNASGRFPRDWMATMAANVERIIPGLDVEQAVLRPEDGSEETKDRNRAVMAARNAFARWQPDLDLGYIAAISTFAPTDSTGPEEEDRITDYVPTVKDEKRGKR